MTARPLNYNPAADGGYILSYPMPNTAVPDDSKIGQDWNASHLCWDDGTNMGFARTCGPASMGHFTAPAAPLLLLAGLAIPDRRPLLLVGHGTDVPEPAVPDRRHRSRRHGDERHGHLVQGRAQRDDLRPARHVQHQLEGLLPRRCRPAALFLPEFSDNHHDGKLAPINDFLSDAAAGQLPQFSLVDPYTKYSEEDGDISIGEAYAARIIDAVLHSPNWPHTVMFLVYDEHGGWYDHVPPQPVVRPDNVPPRSRSRRISRAPTTTPGSGSRAS